MASTCDCCEGQCEYCKSMHYSWPNIRRITGNSKCNIRKHMKLHPCCKKTSKAAVVHPLLNRPLIVHALPQQIQARILLHFGSNPPRFHPFPRPLESLFEDQVQSKLTKYRTTWNQVANSYLMTSRHHYKVWAFQELLRLNKLQRCLRKDYQTSRYLYKYIYLMLATQCEFGRKYALWR